MFSVEYYLTENGANPVAEWLESFSDGRVLGRILTRISRVQQGALGDSKSVGDGVGELVLDFGPGYRIYFAKVGTWVILLLGGGDKSTQKRDIAKAKANLADYLERGS
jgi:putative addiction module killer protein